MELPATTYMQRLIAKGIGAVHLHTRIQEQLQHILVAMQCGQVQRRLSVLILGIEIPIATFQQLEDHLALVLAGGTMQQISHALAASVVRRRFSHQWHC